MILQLLLNGVIAGAVYALVALGFTLIYRAVRFFHFAHGAVYTIGAYVAYTLSSVWKVPFAVSFVLASLTAGIVGVVIERGVYGPLRRRNSPALVFLIASFGVFIFVQNLVQLFWGTRLLILRVGGGRIYRFLDCVITGTQAAILTSAVGLALVLWTVVAKTRAGKAMRAVSDDPIAAGLMGIDAGRSISFVFFIGSFIAGAAGTLIALETNLEPTMGLSAVLKGMIASIFGGLGSIPGAVCGGMLLGIAENVGIWKISSVWKDCISFLLLAFVLFFRPKGLFGGAGG